jgi:activator of HSP90 ATPase
MNHGKNDPSNGAQLAITETRRRVIAGAAGLFGAFALGLIRIGARSEDEVSHTAESIHQEPAFKASRKRVYEALIETKQFDKVVRLSAAMQSGMSLGNAPTEITNQVGGAFTLFGGHILGRQVELVRDERIVQAWRVATWDPGVYSIARFELKEQGSGTKLFFDHTGFPAGQGQHLAEGWRGNYWEPLEKYLAG